MTKHPSDVVPPKRYVSDRVIAAMLDCSRATVWRRVEDGTLTPVRFGSTTRFDLDQVLAALKPAGR